MNLEGVSGHFLLCNGKSCTRKGAEAVTQAVRKTINDHDFTKSIHTTKTWCNGQCKHGPIVISYPKGDWYQAMTPTLAKQLVLAHIQRQPFLNNRLYTYAEEHFKKEEKDNTPKEG
ncbi:(2Fe-2S) ferredoxin domain-containing protein [Shouchella shacheensis]|uniref:(2Fe-2S) ferredoxin domain-containing protein n=1 Tax=Shouchella shacheensis TaxID=1649580 RepID=UPI0007403ACB|nr:(2Fe-2S) ferredoxin domain-containing protein [Shouchella shacheensis]